MYWTDFHIHSSFSDGVMNIPQIVDFYGRRNFGSIAITDHLCEESGTLGRAAAYMGKTLTRASFPLYQEILKSEAKRAWTEYGMLLIPGLEITKNSLFNHRAAHVIALGVTEWISADQDLKSIAREIRNKGGLAIAAHPLSPHPVKNQPYYLWDRREELKDEFDAWEVTYSATLLNEVLESGLPRIANSDLHKPSQIQSWKTLLSCARTQDSIFSSLRAQELKIAFYQGELKVDRSPSLYSLGQHLWLEPLGNLASA